MVISLQNKYIFLEVPKTGTRSVRQFLIENDDTAFNNVIKMEGEIYKFRGHMRAREIKKILGRKYETFEVFGFIRHPYARLVSSYYFYRDGDVITEGNVEPWPGRLRIAFARALPFKVWALLYPYKSNLEYFIDDRGNQIVENIGTFENLNEDLQGIIEKLNLPFRLEKLPHVNKSHGIFKSEYFSNSKFLKLLKLRHKNFETDLQFYKKNENKGAYYINT